jgi:nesprin-1
MSFLQSVVAEHQRFDELLLSFSVWIKLFLSELQTTSEISLMDHQVALTRHKVKWVLLRWKKDLFGKESS